MNPRTTTFEYASLDFECSYTVQRLDADEAGGPGVVYEVQTIDVENGSCGWETEEDWLNCPVAAELVLRGLSESGESITWSNLYEAAESAARQHHESRRADAEDTRQTSLNDEQ